MKTLLAFFLCLTSQLTSAQGIVTLIVDRDHLQMQRTDGTQPKTYAFPATALVSLDSSRYDVRLPAKLEGKSPNSIQLVMGNTEKYSAKWLPGQKLHVLSAQTLTANPGSIPFAGFRSGKEGIVAVGHMDANNFSVAWVGMFRVQ